MELESQRNIPLVFRYHKMKSSKMKVAKAASKLIEDGDTVFIDATTTTQYMGHYLENKKELTVITNNMALATYLSDIGTKVICLGGTIVEAPYMLSGIQAVENAKKLHADKMFFSSAGITDKGNIVCAEMYYSLYLAMMENSDKVYYLVDKGKLNPEGDNYLCDIDSVNTVISDMDLEEIIKKEYENTEYIIVRK